MLVRKLKNTKEYFIRALLLVVPLCFLILIEYSLRLRDVDFIRPIRVVISGSRAEDFRDYHMFTDKDFIPDPYLFWKLNPKSRLSNSKGFIAPEFSITKPDNVIRIFCIGDSNTMGTPDGSYPLELNNLLQSHQPPNKKIEVVNAGLSGYTSLQGLRLFSEIIKYKPDLVTVCFGWNDPCSTSRKPDKYFCPLNKSLLYLERYLYQFRTFQLLKYSLLKFKYTEQQRSNNFTRRVSLEDYENNLVEMANLAKINKNKLLFITRPCIATLEPWMVSFIDDTKVYNSVMRSVAQRLNIGIIDAEAIYNNHEEYFTDSCHFNDKGRKLLAEIVYNYTKEQINNSN